MTEKAFQTAVLRLAALYRWRSYHTRDSRKSAAGFPDLVLVHPQRGIVYAELKSDSGKLRPEQEEWIELLTAAGARVFVWRPDDFPAIASILSG